MTDDVKTSNILYTVPSLKQQHYQDNRKEESEKKKEAKANKPPVKKRGRPRKTVVESKKKRGQVGRPKGDAAIINEYKARMLASPKSVKVIEAIYNAALDDEHKNQAAAWKLIMDRMLPVSAFEKEVGGGNSRPTVQINFGVIGNDDDGIQTIDGDVIDG